MSEEKKWLIVNIHKPEIGKTYEVMDRYGRKGETTFDRLNEGDEPIFFDTKQIKSKNIVAFR